MFNKELIEKFHKPVPRYTSYPTAPAWKELGHETYQLLLRQVTGPLSLYVHVPFCKTMCLYCGCAVVLNRKPENEERYVSYLCREIALAASCLKEKMPVNQLHFGGGTPTKLSESLLERLFTQLNRQFHIDFSKEIAIEVDPRTVMEDEGAKLRFLKKLGFNRISLGVQDTNPDVQEAVKRRQSEDMTRKTFLLARELGFTGINIDLIYGLPRQTQRTFENTISAILSLRPDRIALFSYAKVPWIKPHQKAIPEHLLPSTEVKFHIYETARRRLLDNGYTAIGMDHFALKEDVLSQSYRDGTLYRNFQGYSTHSAETLLGFGMTAIGNFSDAYVQNHKTLMSYYDALDRNDIPVCRGIILTEEDKRRRWVIMTLMCRFQLDKREFAHRFRISFDFHFLPELEKLKSLEEDGLVKLHPDALEATPLGKIFIRLIASVFDAYAFKDKVFSQSI